jgi:hypothetical protein
MEGLAYLQTPLIEITEEPSGDLTNASFAGGGKKKKKKKKRRNEDMSYSYAVEDDMLEEGNRSHRYNEKTENQAEEKKMGS